ncbi:MAG: ATP-binding cassette domain-containing protein, partial [Firmicutes bacterium]|nr:ATP-binding cassette domain-containing protein [Bacillota bacterium]
DEPTNHLDITRIEWLESYIKSFKGAMVIVSHDRAFLDKVSNKILELDDGEFTVYNTNYSGYLEEKERNFLKQMENFKDQQSYFKRLEEKIKYFASRGMATNSSTLTKKAASLQTRLDREKQKAIKRPQQAKNIKMDFDQLNKSSKRVLEVKGLTVKTLAKTILNNVDIRINMGESVAIIGDNGSGKTTFIKTILGIQELDYTGEVFIGPSVKIGYIPQIINFENPKQTILDYCKQEANFNEQSARSLLAAFNFYSGDTTKLLNSLSGGERIRLRLAVLLQQQVNTLIFDEPTNHIDIPTKESLEAALEDFNGTLIFISHDRYFINKFAKRIIEFKNGVATSTVGNYKTYKML